MNHPKFIFAPFATFTALALAVHPTPSAAQTLSTSFAVMESTVPVNQSIHVDCSAAYPQTKLQSRNLYINFGDASKVADPQNYLSQAQVDVGANWPGSIAAHRYLNPGTYTITLSSYQRNADGTDGKLNDTYTTSVTITPSVRKIYYVDSKSGNDANTAADAAHAWQTLDHAIQTVMVGNYSHLELRLAPGETFPLSLPFPLANTNTDIVIGVPWGSPNATIYRATAGDFWEIGPNASDVAFQGINFDSAYTNGAGINNGGLPCHYAVADCPVIRGTNFTFADCGFANLRDYLRGDPALHGLYALRCIQTDPQGTSGYCNWVEGDQWCEAGCTWYASSAEPCIRADGNGTTASKGATHSSIVFTRAGQQWSGGKGSADAGITFRFGNYNSFYNNLLVDSPLSINAPGMSEVVASGINKAQVLAQTIDNCDIRRNLCVGLDNPGLNIGFIELLPGTRYATVLDNRSYQNNTCYYITATDANPVPANRAIAATGIIWHNNTGATLASGGTLLRTTSPLPANFQSDYALPAAQIAGATPLLTVPAPLIGAAKLPTTMPASAN